MHDRRQIFARLTAIVALVVAIAACAGSGSATSAPSPSPAPSLEPVDTPEEAIARIVALEPRLTGIQPVDPDAIGQARWYEATPTDDGYSVEVYLGWGDCMAGCIEHHAWRYAVHRDGTVTLLEEEGDPVPDAEWPSPGGTGRTGIFGSALAGPTCPVEQPGDPACAARPVPGAVVVIRDAGGAEIATAVTDESGRFFVELAAGDYTVVPQPVEGLLGVPPPVPVQVTEGETVVELAYDTGIR